MNILFIAHNLGPQIPESQSKANQGGCEKLMYELAHQLSIEHTIYILYPDLVGKNNRFLHKIESYRNECIENMEEGAIFNRLETFKDILDKYEINLIHYHHLIHNPVEYVLIADLKKIPQVLSIHDYYFICEEHFLENDKYITCDVPANIIKCQRCLHNKLGATASSVAKRRYLMKRILSYFKNIYFPSKSIMSDYIKIYPEFHDRFKIAIIGINPPSVVTSFQTNKLVIGIRNYLTYIKGWVPLINVIKLAEKRYPDITFKILCDQIEKSQLQYLEGFSNVVINENLEDVNLLWLPSIAKETYSIIADEAMYQGIPLLCSKKGAIAERFQEDEVFFYDPVISPERVLEEHIAPISKDLQILTQKRSRILNPESSELLLRCAEESSVYFSHQYCKLADPVVK